MDCEFGTAFCCLLIAVFGFTCRYTYLAYFTVLNLFVLYSCHTLLYLKTSIVDVITSLKAYFQFINMYLLLLSNDSTDGEPEEKRRKVANVVINQPATDSKTLVENAQEEV